MKNLPNGTGIFCSLSLAALQVTVVVLSLASLESALHSKLRCKPRAHRSIAEALLSTTGINVLINSK